MATRAQGLLAGRYRKIEPIGVGGMARVFLAEDERLGRRVAIKQLHAESPDEAAERFEREAKLGASLNHPNLVSVFDIATDAESVLIVMEYVEGETLKDAIAAGPLRLPRVVSIVHDVAAALGHAHAHGVIHRDVKPANILLRRDGVTKLADLGIATAAEGTSITRSGMVLGTAAYMAPEQLDGAEGRPRGGRLRARRRGLRGDLRSQGAGRRDADGDRAPGGLRAAARSAGGVARCAAGAAEALRRAMARNARGPASPRRPSWPPRSSGACAARATLPRHPRRRATRRRRHPALRPAAERRTYRRGLRRAGSWMPVGRARGAGGPGSSAPSPCSAGMTQADGRMRARARRLGDNERSPTAPAKAAARRRPPTPPAAARRRIGLGEQRRPPEAAPNGGRRLCGR